MKNAEIREIVATYCDICGLDVTNRNRMGSFDKDFCLETRHKVLGKEVRCMDFYTIKMQIESADISF